MGNETHFGMVGLGVMGRNLLLNIADHGIPVSGYDTNQQQVDRLHSEAAGKPARGFTDLKQFVGSLARPRSIMMLVPAGAPVDSVISTFKPLLEPDDFLIDSGNSYFKDTDRRATELSSSGIGFIGMGISGGESGARRGPSMMAGGQEKDYAHIKATLEAVAAKADGQPCVAHVGTGSAGHYVKMVHNGIEYGLMQLISECYDLMKRGWGMETAEIAEVIAGWATSDIGGFLLEITATVLSKKDDETGRLLVDLIKDEAKQKGTGKWTSQDAMDLRVPVPTIDAAVAARDMSDLKMERVAAASTYGRSLKRGNADVEGLKAALHGAMLVTYAQGMAQLRTASTTYGYGTDLATVAAIWRAGCIIRSALLPAIMNAYTAAPDLPNLLVDPSVVKTIRTLEGSMRGIVCTAVGSQIPVPAMMASLAYLDGYTSERLPANLIQAQRDFFGAHTYARLDKEGVFHTDWSTTEKTAR